MYLYKPKVKNSDPEELAHKYEQAGIFGKFFEINIHTLHRGC